MSAGQEGGESLLNHFVDQAPFPIAMFDREMRYLMHSRQWLSVYGLGDVNIVGKTQFEVFPELKEEWRFIYEHCLEGNVASCDADQVLQDAQREQWLRWKIAPWKDESGAVGGLLMYTEDITASVLY
ncbi:MAG: PAS domain-containing protein, partial [Alphaproteobacteria bacterium]|nr:PAS domain-containing protein [Alphaproteobacteria bacterium]